MTTEATNTAPMLGFALLAELHAIPALSIFRY